MAIFKCKMCGGALEIENNETVVSCEYCGTQQTLPKLDDEKRANLYDRANHFRRNNEFDKAMGIYEQILNEDNTDAEAYWSLVLCRYGIEYVEDPSNHKRVPTVNRAQFTSIFDDDNYKSAIEYADSFQKSVYEEEAKAINEIQKGILAISQKEEPFDVFICYKETDNSGRRTPDSVLANDLYHQLTQEGFKVFFARITLEDKLGSAYEPYIFAALNSAKVMVVLGTKPEFFNAVWVKNEWSRYLALIKNGAKKMLIPAYKDMDPYDLPEEFSHLQAQDMAKLGFMQDLIRGIRKIAKADEPKATVVKETVISGGNSNTAPLLKRAFMFLEDGDWRSANEYCEKVLDIDPECAEAYLGKLMAEFEVKKEKELNACIEVFDTNANYKKIMAFGDERLKEALRSYNEDIRRKIKTKAKSIIKNNISNISTLSIGLDHMVGLRPDGTVAAVGDTYWGQCNVEGWRDIITVSAGAFYTVGLKSDGTVVAVGCNDDGRCDVKGWRDIVAICAGCVNTLGLRADGSVVATDKECNRETKKWSDIISISTSNGYALGLKANGTVVSTNKNLSELKKWRDIVAVSSGTCGHEVGLRADGTVVAVGYNGHGQCNVTDWKNIIAVSAGQEHTVGLKSDGTVVAVGCNDDDQCNVAGWSDIVAVSAGAFCTVGLKRDGTVVTTKEITYLSGIALPFEANDYEEYIEKRKMTIREAQENRIKGEQRRSEEARRAEEARKAEEERKEGIYVKACKECDKGVTFSTMHLEKAIELFESINGYRDSTEKIAECKKKITEFERQRIEAERKSSRRSQGKCQHCGGDFKGLFTKTCVNCGKKKDYR